MQEDAKFRVLFDMIQDELRQSECEAFRGVLSGGFFRMLPDFQAVAVYLGR